MSTRSADRSTIALQLEHVIWRPGQEWHDAVGHLASRFARVEPLDPEQVLAADGLTAQVDELASWAGRAGIDLGRELARWLDEHLSMHVRPDAGSARHVRSLAGARDVVLVSALPAPALEAIARHAGVLRPATAAVGDVRDAAALAAACTRHGVAILARTGADAGAPPTPGGLALAASLDEIGHLVA